MTEEIKNNSTEPKKLIKYSHSRLELFTQCPMRYKLKYLDGFNTKESSIHLELGSIIHKGKEIWGEFLLSKEKPDYDFINRVIEEGIDICKILFINDEKIHNNTESLKGIEELRKKYPESFYDICNKSGLTYDEKLNIFSSTFITDLEEMILNKWKIIGIEKKFEFTYVTDKGKEYIIRGFIDRIDQNDKEELRVVDYKTSKEIFQDDKMSGNQQMFIYSMACENLFEKRPVEFVYDFVFIGKKQGIGMRQEGVAEELRQKEVSDFCIKGRRKLNNVFNKLEKCEENGEYKPNPSPLCAFCQFTAGKNYNGDEEFVGKCEYNSLWERNCSRQQGWAVNKKWGEEVSGGGFGKKTWIDWKGDGDKKGQEKDRKGFIW
jgi:hypothetical protein